MANSNTIFGARLVDNLVACALNGKVNPYTVLATDVNGLFLGDFVKLTGGSADGEDEKNHPIITKADDDDTLVGVVVGFQVNPNYLNQVHRTASTLRTAWVFDDPNGLFEIQANLTSLTTDVGKNANIIVDAGSTITGLSGTQLDRNTLTTSSAQLRIVRLSSKINSEFGLYTKFVCFINEHAYKGTAGV